MHGEEIIAYKMWVKKNLLEYPTPDTKMQVREVGEVRRFLTFGHSCVIIMSRPFSECFSVTTFWKLLLLPSSAVSRENKSLLCLVSLSGHVRCETLRFSRR